MLLRALAAVAGTGGAALLETSGIEFAADDRVLHTDILHAATAHQDNRVFLKVVSFARDVGSDFHAVCESDTGNLADCGVRLSWSLGGDLGADTALEGRSIKSGAIAKHIKTAPECGHACF